jgi:hypothetical protein
MKKVLAVLITVFIVLVVVNRQRLFLRDPLAKVERNGVRVKGARVFINFSNDVLVEEPGLAKRYLVQHWNMRPGVPLRLSCVHWMACWTEADRAESVPLGGPGYQPRVAMSSWDVSFADGSGVPVKVILR